MSFIIPPLIQSYLKAMRLLPKQLTILLVFFGLFFGLTVYFSYWGLSSLQNVLCEQNAYLLAEKVKSTLNSAGNQLDSSGKWSEASDKKIRQYLLNELSSYKEIEEIFLLNGKKEILFSLYPKNSAAPASSDSLTKSVAREITVRKIKNSGNFEASWLISTQKNLICVLRIDPVVRIGSIVHSLKIKWYLLGFAGILVVIFLSLIWSKVLSSPMRHIEKAMIQIDKRKYGYRLRVPKDDPFAKVYEKVNLALQRLEQLDSVQRNAVQRRNALLNEMKTFSRFMDMMAHEVKNPLHALGINLDVLKTKIQKSKPKRDLLKHSKILEHEVDHLQEVIQGFLSYVRPGVPRKERLGINTLIKDVCEMVSPEAKKYKISIETRLGKNLNDVLIDRGQLQQALHNLLINAVHATGEGGKINIRSWGKPKKVFVSIKDTGIGIAKEQLQQIFDLYFTTKRNGSGLGLPISKRIVEANGGTIELESKLNKGTLITISLQAL